MIIDSATIFFSFSFFSLLGWVLEVIYRSVCGKQFINPGLLKGPYLPLYGTCALILMVAASFLHDSHFLIKVFAYLVITTGIEIVSAFVAQYFFQARLWDYSDQRFNYKGILSLKFSIYWVLLAFAFEYAVLPPYQSILVQLSPIFKWIVAGATFSIMLMDFLVVTIGHFLRLTPKEKLLMEEEFANLAKPLLELPEVAQLAQYNHHKGKNRLDHVKEVAYLSFLWGKKLSLDNQAIIRGALLHDLFYYDWLRGGPKLHGFRHPAIALTNAGKITNLTAKEADIIKKHMWPLTVIPPRYKESMIVSLVDTYCSMKDYLNIKNNRGGANWLRRLRIRGYKQ